MEIYYDSIQEGVWFKGLHRSLADAKLLPFPPGMSDQDLLAQVLAYDRPDVVLCDKGRPILVVERTAEVPSGHNVGQRFARLVAAAQLRIPIVYFGPYKAYKHGGDTQGPRYMNLRLFSALSSMAKIEKSAVTAINWPVDKDCEVIKTPAKDQRMRDYLDLFLSLYSEHGLERSIGPIMKSRFEEEQVAERDRFIKQDVVRSNQYDRPPGTVSIGRLSEIPGLAERKPTNLRCREVVAYRIGMTYIRSDPYAGMAMLYAYLYCGGMSDRSRNLILHFGNISAEQWRRAAKNSGRKDVRLFSLVADGILFTDAYLSKREL